MPLTKEQIQSRIAIAFFKALCDVAQAVICIAVLVLLWVSDYPEYLKMDGVILVSIFAVYQGISSKIDRLKD